MSVWSWNRVPTLIGWGKGMSDILHLWRVAGNTVWSHMHRDPIAVRPIVANRYTPYLFYLSHLYQQQQQETQMQTSRMSMRSSQRSTSGPSSVSARNTAIRAINTAAASWSNPAAMCWMFTDASTQLQRAINNGSHTHTQTDSTVSLFSVLLCHEPIYREWQMLS